MTFSDIGIVLEIFGFIFLFAFPRKLLGFLLSLLHSKNRKFIKIVLNKILPDQKSINFKKYSSIIKGVSIILIISGLFFQLSSFNY